MTMPVPANSSDEARWAAQKADSHRRLAELWQADFVRHQACLQSWGYDPNILTVQTAWGLGAQIIVRSQQNSNLFRGPATITAPDIKTGLAIIHRLQTECKRTK
jgi:hypothetical protein